jgi:hypothetical protein
MPKIMLTLFSSNKCFVFLGFLNTWLTIGLIFGMFCLKFLKCPQFIKIYHLKKFLIWVCAYSQCVGLEEFYVVLLWILLKTINWQFLFIYFNVTWKKFSPNMLHSYNKNIFGILYLKQVFGEKIWHFDLIRLSAFCLFTVSKTCVMFLIVFCKYSINP